jgi:hypothetical protein
MQVYAIAIICRQECRSDNHRDMNGYNPKTIPNRHYCKIQVIDIYCQILTIAIVKNKGIVFRFFFVLDLLFANYYLYPDTWSLVARDDD